MREESNRERERERERKVEEEEEGESQKPRYTIYITHVFTHTYLPKLKLSAMASAIKA